MKDLMEQFWARWIKADTIKKQELLEPVIKMVEEHTQLPDKLKRRSLAMCLNGYFEDLYSVAYSGGVKDGLRKTKNMVQRKPGR